VGSHLLVEAWKEEEEERVSKGRSKGGREGGREGGRAYLRSFLYSLRHALVLADCTGVELLEDVGLVHVTTAHLEGGREGRRVKSSRWMDG